MPLHLKPKYKSLVNKRVARGDSKSAQHAMDQAMSLFSEYDRKLVALRREIDKGIAQLDRGEYTEIRTKAELREFFQQVLREANAKTRKRRRGAA